MKLESGARLGRYTLLAPVGAGGMGEVWRARDTRLGREVAIKVLPEQVARDAEALARFEREARAVGALSHPNILAIHDFGVEEGIAYAVTELLEGRTLRETMSGFPLPVRKTLDYAVQISRGLAAAHEKGIIHRDLKPENLFVTGDGRVKILDFGLAKMSAPGASGGTEAPTVHPATMPGTIMGTVAYMSPEQVRGLPLDPRTDIFSFGAILYEMLSGQGAFRRATSADTMSAILREDPAELPAIPPSLLRLVHHCLEKNASERFQSARDLAFHLEAMTQFPASGSTGALAAPIGPRVPRAAWPRLPLVAAGLLAGLILGAAATAWLRAPSHEPPPTLRYLSYSGADFEPSASLDGRLIAYTAARDGRSQIWLKQLPGGDEAALTAGPHDASPRLAPDRSQVLFRREEGTAARLYRVPVLGGEPRLVVDDAREGDWSPDGREIVFLRTRREEGRTATVIGIADVSGSGARDLTRVESLGLDFPRWSPDGRTIAVVRAGTENSAHSLLLVEVEGGAVREIMPPLPAGRISAPAWVGGGEALVYAKSERLPPDTMGGAQVHLHEIASGRSRPVLSLTTMTRALNVLGPGTLVLDADSTSQNLAEAPLKDGAIPGPPRWITRGSSVDRQPVFSPDGKWLVFTSNRAGNLDLWKRSLSDGTLRRITDDPADDWDPAFSPDGRSILWSSDRSGHFEIWICAADGTGARQLTQDGFDAENPTMTPDGRWVVYMSANPAAPGIWKIRADGTGPVRLVPGSFSVPDVSPDGAWVAYRTAAEPRTVYVAGVEDGRIAAGPWELPGASFNGRARWLSPGRLAFTASDATGGRGLLAQDFVPGRDTLATRRILAGFKPDEAIDSFGISPDGRLIVYAVLDPVRSLLLAEGVSGITPRPR